MQFPNERDNKGGGLSIQKMKFNDINWSDWEECSYVEWAKEEQGINKMILSSNGERSIYLRKKQKLPIVFELGCGYKLELTKGRDLVYSNSDGRVLTLANCDKDIIIIEKAIEKFKELRK